MAFELGSVIAHIKADVSDFKAGIAEAQNEANNFKSHLSGLNSGLKQLGVVGLAAGVAFGAFAIKAGFSAARVEELGFALNAIAKANSIAQTEVDKTVEALRKNNIAHEKALQISALFIQSELDLADAIKLSNVAKDLAVISGQDSSEATRTLTEAISSQHPMLLRQFGIVKSLDQIYEEYAKTNTKTTMVTGESTKAYQKASGSVGELNDKLAIARQRLNEATASGKAKESTLMSLRNTVQNFEQKLASANGTMSQYAGKMISISETSKNLSQDLTEAEKKQAFLNVILESGQKVAGTYDAAMLSVSKRFRSLTGRIIPDFIAQVGLAFQPAMVVIIDAITNSIKNLGKWLDENKVIIRKWGREMQKSATDAVNTFKDFVSFMINHKGIILGILSAIAAGVIYLGAAFVLAHAPAIIIFTAITALVAGLSAVYEKHKIITFILIGAVMSLAAALGATYLVTQAKLIPAFVLATTTFLKLNAVMLLNPFVIIAAAVAALAAGIIYLATQTDIFKTKQDLLREATVRVTDAVDAQWQATFDLENKLKEVTDSSFRLEGAQLAVDRATRNLSDATRIYGDDSMETREAVHQLKGAENDLRDAKEEVNKKLAEAENLHKKAIDLKPAIIDAQKKQTDAVNINATAWENLSSKIGSVIGKIAEYVSKAQLHRYNPLGLNIPGFAQGVRNFAGGMAMVGERGPELLNLPRGSNIIPNNAMAGISSAGNTSVIVNLGGAYIGDMATATRLAEKIGDGIIKKLNRNIRF